MDGAVSLAGRLQGHRNKRDPLSDIVALCSTNPSRVSIRLSESDELRTRHELSQTVSTVADWDDNIQSVLPGPAGLAGWRSAM